jgi:ABC-type polysaccharide/polyol phosphate transport system ATPase subunit
MIREVCNRAIWMDKGVIKMDGETNAVLDAYEADVAEKKAAKEAEDKDK